MTLKPGDLCRVDTRSSKSALNGRLVLLLEHTPEGGGQFLLPSGRTCAAGYEPDSWVLAMVGPEVEAQSESGSVTQVRYGVGRADRLIRLTDDEGALI